MTLRMPPPTGARRAVRASRTFAVLLALAGPLLVALPAGPAAAAAVGTLSVSPVAERTDTISPSFIPSGACPAAATNYIVTLAGGTFPSGTNAVGNTQIQAEERGRPLRANLGNTWNDFADNVGAARPLRGTATATLKCIDTFGMRTYATFSAAISFTPAAGVGDGRSSRWKGTCAVGAICSPDSYRPGADGRTVALPGSAGEPDPTVAGRPAPTTAAGGAAPAATPTPLPGRPAAPTTPASAAPGAGGPGAGAGSSAAVPADAAAVGPAGGSGGGSAGAVTAGVVGAGVVGIGAVLLVSARRRRRGHLYWNSK